MWIVKGCTSEVDKKKSFVKPDTTYFDNQLIRWSQKKCCCSYYGTNDFVNKEYVNSWCGTYNVLNYKPTSPNQRGPKFH